VTPERWAVVQSLFERALEQPEASRRAWVTGACGGDAQLETLVVRLLDADAHDRGELQGAVADAVGDLRSPLATERLGAYRIVSEIGKGGMGTVYLAERDDRAFEQRVAIKVVRGLLDEDRIRRFRAERQILATLDHPNIARLIDGGATPEGWPYLVMEHVDGVPIDRYVTDSGLDVTARLELFLTICRAVSHAHRNLVVHRDIKPANILVTKDGTPKLLDFGIAKLLGPDDSDSVAMTLTGMRLLTPDYAAPEQIRGERITTATDVYALGILLFELLTGRRPFTLAGKNARDIEHTVCDTDPPRPGSIVPLDHDLDVIVSAALEKDPARRYPSVEALADDVRRHIEGRPIEARPSTWRYRAGRFVSRHRWAVATAATFVVLLAGFAVIVSIQAARIAAERDAAERERDTAAEVSDFLVGVFEVSDPGDARGNSVTARELLDRGAERITTGLGDQPAVQSRLMETIGRVYRSLGLFDRSRSVLEQAVEIQQRSGGRRTAAGANALAELAESTRELGKYADAETLHREALEIRRAIFGASSAEIASSLNGLGLTLQALGKYRDAEPLLRDAIDMWRRELPPGDPQVAVALNNLNINLRRLGRLAEAEPVARECLEIRRRALHSPHPLTANAAMQLGQVLHELGRLDEAEPLMREALEARLTLLDKDHPAVSVSYNNLAALLHDRGKLADAETMYRESARSSAIRNGPTHPEYAINLNNLASLLEDRGSYDEAEALFRQALAIRQAALGAAHPAVARGLNNLGRVLALRGKTAEAETLAERSLAMRRKLLGERHAEVAASMGTLGLVRTRQQRLADAEVLFRGQVEMLQALLPADHPSIASARLALGAALRDRGNAAEAIPLLRDALATREKRLPADHWHIGYAQCALGAATPGADGEHLIARGRSTMARTLGPGDRRLQQCAGASPATAPLRR